ncbi:hypothetical protein [Krasilnikovia sp. MM14-A1259]|uniref:hypothetical protein n=1 Tax=Krasilnikovia sp. MM14-A1259 TaxID=3373539 RepID=UPI00380F9779
MTDHVNPPCIGGVLLRAGLRLHVGEADYRYGLGDVDLVVRAVRSLITADDEAWVELETDQVWDGGTRPRLIQVRAAALRTAVRPGPPTDLR